MRVLLPGSDVVSATLDYGLGVELDGTSAGAVECALTLRWVEAGPYSGPLDRRACRRLDCPP
jgi:hypothetical protein